MALPGFQFSNSQVKQQRGKTVGGKNRGRGHEQQRRRQKSTLCERSEDGTVTTTFILKWLSSCRLFVWDLRKDSLMHPFPFSDTEARH